MAFNLTSSHRVASAMALARIPVRTGFAGGGRGMFMTSPVSPLARSRHQSVNYLSLAGGGGKAEPVRWTATAGDRAEAGAFLRKAGLKGRMVAFAPGAAYGPAKRWPDGSWAALADTLELEHGLGVVVVGGAAERSRAGAIAALTARKPVDATGCLSLGGTAALISRCAGFVSNDSGLMHVGATTGVPTVGIFGSSDPAWTAPHGRRCKALSRPVPCAPCFRRTCLPGRGYACLRAVQPASVISALSLLMRQG
jgi:heptosyltransferase-2